MLTFQEENDIILKNSLQASFIQYFQNPEKYKKQGISQKPGIEIYLTPECNQSCSYCYLCAHGDELYPKEIRNKKKILENFKIFLNYCSENNFCPESIDIFSGEVWESELGVTVLETLAEHLENNKNFRPKRIMVPSNCSFVLNEVYLPKIEHAIGRIANNPEISTRFCFSCSNDGYYIDKETRPFNNKNLQQIKGTEEYYNKLFEFCKKWNFAFHPMVSAHGIEYWQENFKWWMESLEKYGFDPLKSIMFLETRNDDWTEDKIINYMRYLNSSIDYLINEIMPKFGGNVQENYIKYLNGVLNSSYNKFNPFRPRTAKNYLCCSLPRTLAVRMGDLAIVPCHRTSYDEFIIGYFQVKDNKIVDVKAKNIQMMNQVWYNNILGTAKCSYCPYKSLCVRGCYGAQYESKGDLFYPCSTVCDLYKANLIFLYHKYKKLNILNRLGNTDLVVVYEQVKETEECKKWSEIAQSLI